MANNRLDVVIFGASGFSKQIFFFSSQCSVNYSNSLIIIIILYTAGKYTVLEGVKLLEDLTWGVAGRDEEKLKRTLKEIGDKAGKDLSSIPIIIADVKDEHSLQKMAERAKVKFNRCFTSFFFCNPTHKTNYDVIVYSQIALRTKKKFSMIFFFSSISVYFNRLS